MSKISIDELAKMFYPSKETLEEQALIKFFDWYCDEKYRSALCNALLRGGIRSIRQFFEADIEDLKKLRNVGDKKIVTLIDLKIFLHDIIDRKNEEVNCDGEER